MMDRALELIIAKQIKKVYDGHGHNVGSTEWLDELILYNGKAVQVLAIGGSDEALDWFLNVLLASWDGIKLCNYISAKRILKSHFFRVAGVPLYIGGHSKSGHTATRLSQIMQADGCLALCPAPAFRKVEKITNVKMIVDPDDPVPHLGKINFKHPDCEVEYLPEDKKGFAVGDHLIDHIIEYLK